MATPHRPAAIPASVAHLDCNQTRWELNQQRLRSIPCDNHVLAPALGCAMVNDLVGRRGRLGQRNRRCTHSIALAGERRCQPSDGTKRRSVISRVEGDDAAGRRAGAHSDRASDVSTTDRRRSAAGGQSGRCSLSSRDMRRTTPGLPKTHERTRSRPKFQRPGSGRE